MRELQKRLAEAGALDKAGKYRQGLEMVSEVARQGKGVNYAPLRAEERFLRGLFLHKTGDAKAA